MVRSTTTGISGWVAGRTPATRSGTTHLVGEVEAIIGTFELQRPSECLFPLHTTVNANLLRQVGVLAGLGAGARAGAGWLPAHLVEDHLPILWVPRCQEHLLAFFMYLVDARGQV